MTTSNSNGTILPSEVGWQFVPQYYTFVNKDPSRLHCFYTKTSTFSHGTEGEDVKPSHGQQEIHSKITSIAFNDCKVFIHSVDAQASSNGGIIIQVIGEMSNNGEPWRKFVQTFFLAEQPNGYFVLNDIFRFLKEDAVDEGDESYGEQEAVEPTQEPAPAPVISSPAPPPAVAEPAPEPPRSPSPPPPQPAAAAPPPPPAVEEEKPEETPEPEPEVAEPAPAPQTNGDSAHAPEPEKPAVADQATAPPPAAAAAAPSAPAPAPPAAAPPVQAAAPPPAAPAPAAPAAPRTWASLAASNARKWGTAVSTDVRGVTETPSPVVSATPSRTQTPPVQRHASQSGGPQTAATVAQSVNHPSCFVKGVTEPVSQALLSATLTQRFGPIKDLDVVHSKACAFLEFQTIDAARKAIVASLPQAQGGEGGIWIETEGAGRVRISVETKKERGDRPPARGRGGPPSGGQSNADGRGGGFRGRGGQGQGPRGRGGQTASK